MLSFNFNTGMVGRFLKKVAKVFQKSSIQAKQFLEKSSKKVAY